MTPPLHVGMRRTVEWARPLPPPASPSVLPLEWLRRLRSGTVLVALGFVAVFSLAAVPPIDPDLWWHLANGRLMLAMGAIPHGDLYSFSAAGRPWVMHEWLADLGMFGLYRLAGLPLLVAACALLVTAAAGCLYWLQRRSGLPATPSLVLTVIGALAGSTAWGARPQVLNPLFTGLLLVGLWRYRDARLPAWMLPPFLWLWANLHSGFVAGFIIVALFAAGEAVDGWRGSPSAMPGDRIRGLALALGVSLPLTLINPFGIQALLFAFGTLTSPLIQNNIQEWASPDFHSMAGLLFELILLVMIGGLITRKVVARTAEWMLALAFLYLALSSQRHVGLFLLAAAPLYGKSAQALMTSVRDLVSGASRLRDGPSPPDASNARIASRPAAIGNVVGYGTATPARFAAGRTPSLALGVLNLALLLAVGAGMIIYRALPNLQPNNEAAAIKQVLPVDATVALARLHRPMRVFNYYDYGGYLIWSLYPDGGRVYIDGRIEVYGAAIFTDYLRVNYLADGWPAVMAAAQPDAVIFPNGHPLLALLQRDANWQQFSRDRVATVLVRVGFAP